MSISIVDRRGAISTELSDMIERRLRFALSRFESKTRGVSVVIEDVNGPRGGVDQSCRITVRLRAGSDVIVNHQDADVAKCVARAAERAGRAVTRAVERQRHIDRNQTREFPFL